MDLFETLGLGARPVQENTVSFAIYPDAQPADDASLDALHAACIAVIEPLLQPCYIWQVEPVHLQLSTRATPLWWQQPRSSRRRAPHLPLSASGDKAASAGGPGVGCVWGALRWGDNVEDEWWLVYLLQTCTAAIPDISAQVWDNDGEFLLIEAAFAIPRWLKPDVASNRVWLRGGALHIIPQPGSRAAARATDLPAFPTLAQALQVLASGKVDTMAPKADAVIRRRLAGFPDAAKAAGCHVARACLPPRLAAVLATDPQLVAAAITAFLNRDAEDMTAAARMAHFPVSEPRVTVRVATNRCQHAQLCQQRFAPPRGWRLPPPGHPLAAAADRGLKIVAGFEILATRAVRRGLSVPPLHPSAQPPETPSGAQIGRSGEVHVGSPAPPARDESARWAAYVGSLEASGFFQGEREGSAKHRERMAVARRDFEAAQAAGQATGPAPALGGGVDASSPDPVLRLLSLLGSPAGRAKEEDFPPGEGLQDDDDSWMDALPDQLTTELASREAELEVHKGPQGRGRGPRMEVDAGEVAAAVRGFVDYGAAGVEGAEAPRGAPDAAGLPGFDAAAFVSQLQRVLGGDEHSEQDEWEETSNEEGSSFFSDNDDDDDDGDSDSDVGGGGGGTERGPAAEGSSSAGRPAAGPHLLDTEPAFRSSRPGRDDGNRTAASRPEPCEADEQAGKRSGSGAAPLPLPAWPKQPTLAALQEHWEVCTATDSDDDEGEEEEDDGRTYGDDEAASFVGQQDRVAFMEAYSSVLAEQLESTTLSETVERAPRSGGVGAGDGGTQSAQPPGQPLQPLDLDFNLVRSLLKSVSAQQGLAGPASNLAGLLGMPLAPTEDEGSAQSHASESAGGYAAPRV